MCIICFWLACTNDDESKFVRNVDKNILKLCLVKIFHKYTLSRMFHRHTPHYVFSLSFIRNEIKPYLHTDCRDRKVGNTFVPNGIRNVSNTVTVTTKGEINMFLTNHFVVKILLSSYWSLHASRITSQKRVITFDSLCLSTAIKCLQLYFYFGWNSF